MNKREYLYGKIEGTFGEFKQIESNVKILRYIDETQKSYLAINLGEDRLISSINFEDELHCLEYRAISYEILFEKQIEMNYKNPSEKSNELITSLETCLRKIKGLQVTEVTEYNIIIKDLDMNLIPIYPSPDNQKLSVFITGEINYSQSLI
jgi:hypothetical protein